MFLHRRDIFDWKSDILDRIYEGILINRVLGLEQKLKNRNTPHFPWFWCKFSNFEYKFSSAIMIPIFCSKTRDTTCSGILSRIDFQSKISRRWRNIFQRSKVLNRFGFSLQFSRLLEPTEKLPKMRYSSEKNSWWSGGHIRSSCVFSCQVQAGRGSKEYLFR